MTPLTIHPTETDEHQADADGNSRNSKGNAMPAHGDSAHGESAHGETMQEPTDAHGSSDVAEATSSTKESEPNRKRKNRAREQYRIAHRRKRIFGWSLQERQSIALTTLAVLAVLYTAYLARAILFPMMLALILALTFRPVVRALRRRGVPMALSSAVIMAGVMALFVLAIVHLAAPAKSWFDDGPAKMQLVAKKLSPLRKQFEKLQEAVEQVENVASGKSAAATGKQKTSDEPIPVEVKQPPLTTNWFVFNFAGNFMAGVFLTFVLAFFLLSSSDILVKNVLQILPSMREKRNAVELVHNVERGISSYLFTVACINVTLGIVVGIAMAIVGLPNPALWGVMATLVNFVPFIGPIVGTLVLFVAGVVSFDSLGYAVLPPAVYGTITAIEGNFITPAIIGRSMSLNPVVVFVSLTFWGWMWGVGGALLAVPIVAMLKVGFDQFDRTRPIGTLLGG